MVPHPDRESSSFADPKWDIYKLFDISTPKEESVIRSLFPVVSDMLRFEAHKVGKDLDSMAYTIPGYSDILKWVVFDVVSRYITNQYHVLTSIKGGPGEDVLAHKPITQTTHSAGGYSVTNTYQAPVPGLYIKKSELARLGLRRQQVGVINFGGSV